MLGAIQHYIYRKPDSVRGTSGMWQWLTTAATKKLIMEKLRDSLLMEGRLVVRSTALVAELAGLRRDGDKVAAVGRQHDDRAITAAMAIECWTEQVLPQLLMLPPEPNDDGSPPDMPEAPPVANTMVKRFFDRLQVPL